MTSNEFLSPEVVGYVGWVGNINPTTSVKLYVSNITIKTLDDNYVGFTSRFPIECLKLIPKKPEEDLVKTLFWEHTTFSQHFDRANFELISKRTDCSLLDVINYIPTGYLPNLISEENARKKRMDGQNAMLQAFCYAYKSYYGKG